MEITLSRVVEAARQRRAALTAEAGGYIVLRVLQRLAACPRQVTADHVGLTAAGEVELAPSALGEAREVETELRGLLASLLALSQSVPPALRATCERPAVGDLAALEAELAAALIPINHAAQGRALARLFRETHKASGGAFPAPPSAPLAVLVATPVAPVPPTTPLPAASPSPNAAVLEWEELAIDVEIELSENAAADADESLASDVYDSDVYDDVEVLLVADDLDEPLAAEVPAVGPVPADELAVPATAASAAVPAREVVVVPTPAEPVSARPTAVSELSATPLPLSVEPRLAAWTPLPPSSDSPELHESPLPPSWPCASYGEPEPLPQRSDLRELLQGYLSHTRCEEDMTADLRRMIGLDPWRAAGAAVDRPELGR
jgi:hypothetical protein